MNIPKSVHKGILMMYSALDERVGKLPLSVYADTAYHIYDIPYIASRDTIY